MLETFFRYTLAIGISLTLVSAGFWLVRGVADRILSESRGVLMPFQTIGKEDPSGKLGLTLAQMLIARVARIEQEMETSARALKEVREAKQAGAARTEVRFMETTADRSLTVPEHIFEAIDLKLTLGGVEVGPIVSWFHRLLSNDRGFVVSVEFLSDRAFVAVIPPGGQNQPLHLSVDSSENSRVIEKLAYSIMQQQMAQRIPKVSALTVEEFSTLLTTLNSAAQTNLEQSLGAQVSESYSKLLKAIIPLVQKLPRWTELLRVAAEMAENSGDDSLAEKYYERELALLESTTPAYENVKDQLRQVHERLRAKNDASMGQLKAPARFPGAGNQLDQTLERLHSSRLANSILKLIGVNNKDMTGEVVVAVGGGLPSLDNLPEGSYGVLGRGGEDFNSDPRLQAYVDSLVQWVKLVAPKVRFVFAPLSQRSGYGGFSMAELIRSFDLFVGSDCQVILWTFGPMTGTVWSKAMERAASKGILVVQAAGNEPDKPVPFSETNLIKRIAVSAAVSQDGKRAEFSPSSGDALWAPGVDIPIWLPEAKEFSVRSGTSYSAALCAGVAARIYGEERFDSPEKVVKLLQETAMPIEGQSGPAVINLNNALDKLRGLRQSRNQTSDCP